MELYQLEQFMTAAKLSHITKAAKKLSVSQPALSKTIKNLESELGYPLFDHVGKNVRLNENGRILLKHTEEIFYSIENAKRAIIDANTNSPSVSLYIRAASKLIPEILLEYHHCYPDVEFSLSSSSDTETATKESQIYLHDFTIDSSLEPAFGNSSVTLLKEDLIAVLPSSHPLCKNNSIQLSDLKEEYFISLKKGMSLASITEYYCRLCGFIPHVIFESDNPATLRNLIEIGLGIAIVPAITWDGIAGEGIRLLPIRPLPCHRYINLYWSPSRYLSKTALDFKDFLIKYFKELGKKSHYKEK